MAIEWHTGWVSVIDVVGFSDRLRTDPDKLGEMYSKCVRLAKSYPTPDYQLNASDGSSMELVVKVFSDSIFVFPTYCHAKSSTGPEPTDLGLSSFFAVSSLSLSIFQMFMSNGLSLRAGMAHGRFHANVEEDIFMGDAIVKAHRWESQQQWLWLSVAPDSFCELPGNIVERNILFRSIEVPTKQGFVPSITLAPDLRKSSPNEEHTFPDQMVTTVDEGLKNAFDHGDIGVISKWRSTASYLSCFLDGIGVNGHRLSESCFPDPRLESHILWPSSAFSPQTR